MPNRFSPGRCCKNDCPAIDLVQDGDWSDWETVPDLDDDGYLEPGTIAETTVSRPDGAWCVDVEILDSAESVGTTIEVDSLARAEINHGNVPLGPGWYAPRDYIQYGNECYTHVIDPSDIAWVRIKETYEVEHRSQEIEVWKTDPVESLLSYGGQTASRKPIIESVPTVVTIRIIVGDTRIKIGRVRVLDMAKPTYVGELVNAKCPTVDLAVSTPHNVVTGVRTVYEGILDEWAKYTGTGYRIVFGYSGPEFPLLDGDLRIDLSSSDLNGSYAWRLYKSSLVYGSPADTLLTPEEQAEAVAEALSGFIPCDYSYTWMPPIINYSDLVTMDIVATNYPAAPAPQFNNGWYLGLDRLWRVGDYRPFPYAWVQTGQPTHVPGTGGTTITSLEPFYGFVPRPRIITSRIPLLSSPDDDLDLVRSMTFSRVSDDYTATEYLDQRNKYGFEKPRVHRFQNGGVYDYNRLEYDQVIVG